MKKRLIAMLIVLAMAICVFPVCAFAAPVGNSGGGISPLGWGDEKYWHIYIDGAEKRVPIDNVIGPGSVDAIGEEGPVTIAQKALNCINENNSLADCNAGIADGIYGNGTTNAVKHFQTYVNRYQPAMDILVVDGWIGSATWKCITAISK